MKCDYKFSFHLLETSHTQTLFTLSLFHPSLSPRPAGDQRTVTAAAVAVVIAFPGQLTFTASATPPTAPGMLCSRATVSPALATSTAGNLRRPTAAFRATSDLHTPPPVTGNQTCSHDIFQSPHAARHFFPLFQPLSVRVSARRHRRLATSDSSVIRHICRPQSAFSCLPIFWLKELANGKG